VILDDISWGVLPDRALQPLYPTEFEGEIGSEAANGLIALLRAQTFQILLDYLARAEHSSRQCRELLRRRQFHPSLIEEALGRMREQNYLDDGRFAEVLVRSYLARHASRRTIIAKLREHRLPSELWEPILAELWDKEEAAGSLANLMRKYCASRSALPRPKLKEKAFTHFYRKGFDLDEIRTAWEEWSGV
jgi:regulatory protein